MFEDTLTGVRFVEKKLLFAGQGAPMQIVQRGFPIDRLATDQMDELPVTDSGKKYILVVSDYFTRWNALLCRTWRLKQWPDYSGRGYSKIGGSIHYPFGPRKKISQNDQPLAGPVFGP